MSVEVERKSYEMAPPARNSDPMYWSSRVEVGCALQIFRSACSVFHRFLDRNTDVVLFQLFISRRSRCSSSTQRSTLPEAGTTFTNTCVRPEPSIQCTPSAKSQYFLDAELAHPEVLSDGLAYAAPRLLNLALSSHAPALYILARRCQNILKKFKGGKGQGYGTPLPPWGELVAEIVARAAAASGWTYEE